MKKILAIGGLGFIGTNFYRLFHSAYQIYIFDANEYPSTLRNGLWDMESPECMKGDVENSMRLQFVIQRFKPDFIINFAAKSHVDRSINEADSFLPTNTIGVENILKLIKGTNIRLVQFSTDEVYGDTDLESQYEFMESDPLNPSSPYSASKAAADMLVNAYVRTFGVNAVTVRPTNNYGMYQYPEKFLPFLIKRKAEGKTLPIYGEGMNVREWLYVEDCVRAVELVMREGTTGEVYNIGSGVRESNIAMAKLIGGELEYVQDRKGHDRRYAVNCDKVRSLGWKPEASLPDMVQMLVGWYTDRFGIIKNLETNPHIK